MRIGFVCRNGEGCASTMVELHPTTSSPLWTEERGIGSVIIKSDCQWAIQIIDSSESCFMIEGVGWWHKEFLLETLNVTRLTILWCIEK